MLKKIGILVLNLLFIAVLLVLLPIFYVLWRVWAYIINVLPSNSIRHKNGTTQTPIVYFRHPETQRQVVLVGTMHIGEFNYFPELQCAIDALPGYTVLYEAIRRPAKDEIRKASAEARAEIKKLNRGFQFIRKLTKFLSLQYQRPGLTYHPHWINSDLSTIEYVQAHIELKVTSTMSDLQELNNALQNKKAKAFLIWLFNLLLSRMRPISLIASLLQSRSRASKITDHITLNQRNALALQAIDQHIKQANVVSIWGAAHLPGIMQGLTSRGYIETHRTWHTAYRDRKYRLWHIWRNKQAILQPRAN